MCVVRAIRSIIHTRPRSLHSDSRSDLDQDAPTSDDAASKTQTNYTFRNRRDYDAVNSPIRNPDIASLRVLAFIQLDLSTKARVETRGRARRQTLYSRNGKRTKPYTHTNIPREKSNQQSMAHFIAEVLRIPIKPYPKSGGVRAHYIDVPM